MDNLSNIPVKSSEPSPRKPDFDMARKFLAMLAPKATSFTFQIFDDDKNKKLKPKLAAKVIIGSFDAKWPELTAFNAKGYGIYVTVNETDGTGRKKENIMRARAVWQELDLPKDGSVPIDEADAYRAQFDSLLSLFDGPSIEVETSPGNRHNHFLCDNLSLGEFDGCQRRMVESHGSDKNAADRCRVLRIPGFYNHKYKEPFLVRLIGGSGKQYSRGEILAAFPPIARAECAPIKGDVPYSASTETLIRSYVEAIPGQKAEARHDWFTQGPMFARLGDDWAEVPGRDDIRLELWEALSRKCKRFEDATGCAEKWDDVLYSAARPHEKPATFWSLKHMAEEAGWTWENNSIDPALIDDAKAALAEARGRVSAEEAFDPEEIGDDCREKGDGEQTAWPKIMRVSDLRGPAPKREWVVPGLIPSGSVTLLTGDGGVGKSLLACQLCAAMNLNKEWLGRPVVPGRTLYLSAEDDRDELHRRFEAVARHYGASTADLDNVEFLDYTDADAILGAKNVVGSIAETKAYRRLKANIEDRRPTLLIVDTLADTFGGDEIVRAQVGQFISLLRRLPTTTLLLAHPSLSGMASGSGTSGSTGWHNKVRSRLYFESNGKDDSRTLIVKKSNYGPLSAKIKLRWNAGVFVPVLGATIEETDKSNAEADAEFLDLMAKSKKRGENLSESKFSSHYAPRFFADGDTQAVEKFEETMERLINSDTIRTVKQGPKSRPENWLELAETEGGKGQSAPKLRRQ